MRLQYVNADDAWRYTHDAWDMLVKVGLVRDPRKPVKVLSFGETKKKFNVTAAKFSESAKQKITDAGGTVNEG